MAANESDIEVRHRYKDTDHECITEGCDRNGTERFIGPHGETYRCEPCSRAWTEGHVAGHQYGKNKERYGGYDDDQ